MHARIFSSMVDQLCDVYPNQRDAELWMRTEQKLLGGRRPVDCSPPEVWAVIDQLVSNTYV